ncbi:MAG: GNAT family N-acetyltransferase [Dongiaceae bacterium]
MTGFRIRNAMPADAPIIAEIHERGWILAYGDFVSPEMLAERSAAKRISFWQDRIADATRLVLVGCEADGTVMGMVYGGPVLPHDITSGTIEDFDSELYILHCRREVQGRGLGRQLTGELAHRFQRAGARSLVLWAFSDNAFRRFYDRLGGEVVAAGQDEGQTDVAYGWRDLNGLIAACEGGRN